jgi:hypothetical protein
MSTPVALPAPRVFRLPRVRFKRPRWPRGNRAYLGMLGLCLAVDAFDAAGTSWGWLAVSVACTAYWARLWWRSRDDDDGPSAT